MTVPLPDATTRAAPSRRQSLNPRWAYAVFALSFLAFLFAAFPAFGETEFYGLELDATTPQLLRALGGSDAGSYTTLAYDFLDGTIDPANQWILNLWPPGVPFVLWVIMLLNGGALPIVPMLVVTAVLWSGALALVAAFLLHRRAIVTLVLFGVAWIASPLLFGWTVRGGAISSDGISAALTVVLALGLLFTAQPEFAAIRVRRRLVYFGGLGLLLAALSLFRVTWLFASLAALAALALYLGIRALARILRRRRSVNAPSPTRHLASWAALVATFGLVTGAWTLVLGTVVHPGSLSWSSGDYQWGQMWMDDERLEDAGAQFLIDGETNWACDLDPVQCEEFERLEESKPTEAQEYDGTGEIGFGDFQRAAVFTAIENPGRFIAMRSVTTVDAWLASPGDPVGSMTAVPSGIATLLAFLAGCSVVARHAIRGSSGSFLLLMLAGAHLAMIWLSHFETRYMMTLQAIAIVTAAVALSGVEANVLSRFRIGRKSS